MDKCPQSISYPNQLKKNQKTPIATLILKNIFIKKALGSLCFCRWILLHSNGKDFFRDEKRKKKNPPNLFKSISLATKSTQKNAGDKK